MDQQNRLYHILVVEDNPGDVHLIRLAIGARKIRSSVSVVHDGVEAIRFLRKEAEYKHAIRPDLVILDLGLPKRSGHEVLVDIKSDKLLRSLPVVVFSVSGSYDDVHRVYDERGNAYIRKPSSLEGFEEVIASLESFWLKTATLPLGVESAKAGA